MTILYVCAVRDSAVQAFGRPIFVPALGQALRSFADEVNRKDEQSDLWKHPEDFEFFHIGHFDDSTGQLVPLDKPVSISRGKDVKRED